MKIKRQEAGEDETWWHQREEQRGGGDSEERKEKKRARGKARPPMVLARAKPGQRVESLDPRKLEAWREGFLSTKPGAGPT
jgi:hypothetical protein